jgi:predicted RNA-binding protein with PIN domain
VLSITLVDGYNAIRRIPNLKVAEQKGGLAAGRRALVASILASGILRNERVVIVFDGAADSGPPEPAPHRMLVIRYSSNPESADDSIVALLENAKTKGPLEALTVVTADRDLAFRAKGLGAAVVSPESWAPLQPARRPKPRESLSTSSEKPAATASDVRYWLEVFGKSEE